MEIIVNPKVSFRFDIMQGFKIMKVQGLWPSTSDFGHLHWVYTDFCLKCQYLLISLLNSLSIYCIKYRSAHFLKTFYWKLFLTALVENSYHFWVFWGFSTKFY
jgi:hypothetical protein